MGKMMSSIYFFIIALAILFLAACDSPATKIAHPDNFTVLKSDKKLAIPMELRYRLLGTPAVGESLTIELNLQTKQGDRVSVQIVDSAQLLNTPFIGTMIFFGEGEQSTSVQQVNITPQSAGAHHLLVHAEVEKNGKRHANTFAIPILVGQIDWQAELRPQGAIKNDSAGGKVISLPASRPQ